MSGKEKEEEKQPVGKNYTVFAPERRLDSFAAILAGQSICVAIALINGQFYATANELYSNSKENNRTISAIEEVASYFENLANGKQGDREKVFRTICSYKRLTLLVQRGGFVITEELSEDVAQSVLNHQTDQRTLYNAMYQNRPAAAFGLAYGEYIELYTDFKKLEDTIKQVREQLSLSSSSSDSDSNPLSSSSSSSSSLEKTEEKFSKSQLRALSKGISILMDEPEKDVHAEMQLLSYIVKEVVGNLGPPNKSEQTAIEPTEIYIGISKLCCLSCQKMLDAANDIFKEEKIPIKLKNRGHHDLYFSKWECPKIFANGYNNKGKKPPDSKLIAKIAYKIGKLGNTKIEEALKDPVKRSKIQMGTDISESDTESVADSSRITKLNELRKHKRFLESFLSGEPALGGVIKKISAAIQLYDSDTFNSLWNQEISWNETSIRNRHLKFVSILGYYRGKAESNSAEIELLAILKDPELVGENISSYYKDFTPPSLTSLVSSSNSASSPALFSSELSSSHSRLSSSLPSSDSSLPSSSTTSSNQFSYSSSQGSNPYGFWRNLPSNSSSISQPALSSSSEGSLASSSTTTTAPSSKYKKQKTSK